MKKMKTDLFRLLLAVVLAIIVVPSCSLDMLLQQDSAETNAGVMTPEIVSRINSPDVGIYPEYDGSSDRFFIQMHDGIPYFTDEDYEYAEEKGNFIELSELDSLGRTGVSWGLFSFYTMPTEDRFRRPRRKCCWRIPDGIPQRHLRRSAKHTWEIS